MRSVGQRVGRAELADDTWGPHYSEIEVDLKPMGGEEEEAAQVQIRKSLAQLSGLSFSMQAFLTERIEETISGYTICLRHYTRFEILKQRLFIQLNESED